MGRIVKLPSFKPGLARRQGLRKLSPDLISKARDETATQVTRLGLTFLATAAFCLLSLLSPDSALLGGSEKINVPFAGPAQRPAGSTCAVSIGSAGANLGLAPTRVRKARAC